MTSSQKLVKQSWKNIPAKKAFVFFFGGGGGGRSFDLVPICFGLKSVNLTILKNTIALSFLEQTLLQGTPVPRIINTFLHFIAFWTQTCVYL